MKEWLKKVWRWLRKEILNKEMIVWVIIAELIFWAPCIVGGVLGLIINPWFWTICGVYIAFWTMPLTPAIPIQLGLAFGLKKLAQFIRRHRKKGQETPEDEIQKIEDKGEDSEND